MTQDHSDAGVAGPGSCADASSPSVSPLRAAIPIATHWRKTAVVEAYRWGAHEPNDVTFTERSLPPQWFRDALAAETILPRVVGESDWLHLTIKTLEGDMLCEPDDWIIRGVEGELYPCKSAIFAKTYEPASGLDAVDYEKIARFLFDLLDDIDTAGDRAKNDDRGYRLLVESLHRRRFLVATTDGYTVTFRARGIDASGQDQKGLDAQHESPTASPPGDAPKLDRFP